MSKSKGTYAELIFQARLVERSIACSVPVLDIFGFDVIAGSNNLRVQIKSSNTPDKHGRYKWGVTHGSGTRDHYNSSMVDIMALYILPLDTWYLIPIEEIKTKTISFYPMKEFKYDNYRENWEILS